MRWEALGENAFILRDLEAPAFQLAGGIESLKIEGLVEAVASYDTVGLYVDDRFSIESFPTAIPLPPFEPRRHRIPVCYDLNEDSSDVCRQLGIGQADLIDQHTSRAYTCAALGFCPGFAYLGSLSGRLSKLSRKDSPRPRVEPGSVGIVGTQTAVYPLPRPGGWWLIGRTPLELVNVAESYFPIRAGDEVTFFPIHPDEYHYLQGQRL